MRQDVDAHAARVFAGTLLILMIGFVACSAATAVPLSPATQEALVVDGIALLRDRCTALFAKGDPPASRARDACMVLAAVDRGLMVLEPKVDDSPVSGDGGPMNVEQGNATRRVDGGE